MVDLSNLFSAEIMFATRATRIVVFKGHRTFLFELFFLFIRSFSGQKLYDGRPLGGRGRLTLPRVDAMQVFYGCVLRSTHLSATEKQQQVLAILDHYSEGATHEHCPAGPDSWCKWQHDVACETSTYRPPQDPLTDAIVQVCAMTISFLTTFIPPPRVNWSLYSLRGIYAWVL